MKPLLFICSAKWSYTRNDVLRLVLPRIVPAYREIVSERGTYVARLLEISIRWLASLRGGERVFLGFLAQPLVPLAALLGARNLAMDFFISLYDTLCLDRRTFSPDGAIGRFLKNYDRWCLNRAKIILVDTDENADFYAETFGVDRRRFTAIPVSANPERFKPAPAASSRGPFNVLYYCTFLPLHGAEVVFDAVRLLDTEESIRFTIVGEGPVSGELDRKLESWNLSNVRRVRWIPYEELSRTLAEADLCLGGHFSKNPKAQRVVPGKVYQFLAMAKPVILGDGPANRRCFTHLKDAWLCDATSADDLARGIWELSSDRKRLETIGRNGYLLFQDQFHPEVIAEKLKSLLGEQDATPAARDKS